MDKEKILPWIKLKDIADISSGLVLSRLKSAKSVDTNIDKKYYYIPQKALSYNYLDDSKFEPLFLDEIIEKRYLARCKDIIMKLTPPYDAAIIDFQREDVLIPSNFAIIRTKNDFISVFLYYILNGNNVRKQIKRLVEGSNIPVIKINHLRDIQIKNVNRYKQIKYSQLFNLLDYRSELLDRKREIEETLKNDILSKL